MSLYDYLPKEATKEYCYSDEIHVELFITPDATYQVTRDMTIWIYEKRN